MAKKKVAKAAKKVVKGKVENKKPAWMDKFKKGGK